MLRILGFAGRLRAGSYNKALLHAAADFIPEDVGLETFDIGDIPAFNQDIERDMMPAKVKEFKSKIRDADAILIATPNTTFQCPVY